MEPLLVGRVRNRLVMAPTLDDTALSRAIRQESSLLADRDAWARITGDVAADLTGAGPLEPLLALDGVTDVLVNAPDAVFVDRGRGLERTEVRFPSAEAARALAVRLAGQAGRRLDDAMPFVDVRLPDGTRLHAILPPLVPHPTLSLRVLTRRRFTVAGLVASGLMTEDIAALLVDAVRARLTVLVSGGTGTGKTTLLAALSATVGLDERIITIEDAAELAIDHPHVVSMVARTANTEGAGAVSMTDLVRQALRMRADRLVVGEFRGAEMVELLAALNTGHSGGAATVHANSVRDVRSRLTALAALAGMPSGTLMAQAASALDLLVHVRRGTDGRRVVDEIALWPSEESASAPIPVWSGRDGPGPGMAVLTDRFAIEQRSRRC